MADNRFRHSCHQIPIASADGWHFVEDMCLPHEIPHACLLLCAINLSIPLITPACLPKAALPTKQRNNQQCCRKEIVKCLSGEVICPYGTETGEGQMIDPKTTQDGFRRRLHVIEKRSLPAPKWIESSHTKGIHTHQHASSFTARGEERRAWKAEKHGAWCIFARSAAFSGSALSMGKVRLKGS